MYGDEYVCVCVCEGVLDWVSYMFLSNYALLKPYSLYWKLSVVVISILALVRSMCKRDRNIGQFLL